MLLRWLQRDPLLAGWSHVIVDEVHERSADTDVLLALLKRLVAARPQLRVVLMSATLDAARLATYMGAACAMVNIPHGHTFAVEEYFVDDLPHVLARDPSHRRRMQRLVAHVRAARGAMGDDSGGQTYDGALCELAAETLMALVEDSVCGETMLCFLPGWDEIRIVERLLADRGYGDGGGDESREQSDARSIRGGGQGPQRDRTKVRVHSLHSRLPLAAQRAALAPAEPGVVKVLLATNIAESSLTLPDVTTVVDSGRERTPSWVPEVCSRPLLPVFTIRLGREDAGRERPRGTPIWSRVRWVGSPPTRRRLRDAPLHRRQSRVVDNTVVRHLAVRAHCAAYFWVRYRRYDWRYWRPPTRVRSQRRSARVVWAAWRLAAACACTPPRSGRRRRVLPHFPSCSAATSSRWRCS